jgi:hypothetical protein
MNRARQCRGTEDIIGAMTREESWQVEGVTLTPLRHITSLGYSVSVFRFPSSLPGTRDAAIEMQVINLSTDAPTQHVARFIEGEPAPERP